MRLDHLRPGEGPAAARREPVGDGEQGDVDADRFGRAQVLVDTRRRGSGASRIKKPSRRWCKCQRPQVLGQPAAGAQSVADAGDDLGPIAIVAREATKPSLSPPRRGLADVVEEGAERSAVRAVISIGERLVRAARQPAPARSPAKRSRSASTSSVCSSTSSVWP